MLQRHWSQVSTVKMRERFATDPDRFNRFSLSACGLLLDYSKNRITDQTLGMLQQLARRAGLEEWIARMFSGEKINRTERRAVLHTALRNRSQRPIWVDGADVMPGVVQALGQMDRFVGAVHQQRWLGHTGRPICDVVHIGIGGSDLGPRLVTQALGSYHHEGIRVHFVSNVDGADLTQALRRLDPERTLFIVASKSFLTQETLTNAHSARQWCLARLKEEAAIAQHFVAISANRQRAVAFGIDPVNIFPMWDWVGGRFSLWSTIGLPIALALGMPHFLQLLQGAHEMDEHFRTADWAENMPIILALIGIWNINFSGINSHAVLPYDQGLRRFPGFLQQLEMESNGKQVDREGRRIEYRTAPILWGSVGIDGQHAYFQLLHQGTQPTACDFIVPVNGHNELAAHHDLLLANALAQSEALMRGRESDEVVEILCAEGLSPESITALLPHKRFEGNRPSNTLLMDTLAPQRLGALIALYEHKIFVQGVIWQINSFDQWGVELGKELAGALLQDLGPQDATKHRHDASTEGLLAYIRRHRRP